MVYLSRMPKSKLRKKVAEERAHNQEVEVRTSHEPLESPRWLAPIMVTSFILGLLWIVVFYVSQTVYPIRNIGNWNMVIGFAFIGVGFSLATRWR
jgi:cytoskeletal protein RodZ